MTMTIVKRRRTMPCLSSNTNMTRLELERTLRHKNTGKQVSQQTLSTCSNRETWTTPRKPATTVIPKGISKQTALPGKGWIPNLGLKHPGPVRREKSCKKDPDWEREGESSPPIGRVLRERNSLGAQNPFNSQKRINSRGRPK